MRQDIVIAGVGGQGTVLASRIIARAAMDAGLPVRTSETIGMAQREGVVTSHVRFGIPLDGAVIPDQSADILLGFELAETVRWMHKLKPGGRVVANCAAIIPVSVAAGRSVYDIAALAEHLRNRAPGAVLFDASALAAQAGTQKATNIVLLGALSTLAGLPFSAEELLRSALEVIPTKVHEVNRRAFELGRKAMEVS